MGQMIRTGRLCEARAGSTRHSTTTRAERIARRAHAGQKDKAGNDYILHPQAVAASFSEDRVDERVVAVLHDVVEDTDVSLDDLREMGATAEQLAAIQAITKRPGEDRDKYYVRVRSNPLALAVKKADIANNTDPERLARLDRPSAERLQAKYAHALEVLEAAPDGVGCGGDAQLSDGAPDLNQGTARAAKYEPLADLLQAASDDEPVTLTFAELDRLVGGLPASAREHRSWWGNTFSPRPHAAAWMSTGRRVVELRLGDAVVFSPADALTAPPDNATDARHGQNPMTTRSASGGKALLDGVADLAETIRRAGYKSIAHAVAAHAVFLHPDTVAQTAGKPVFHHVRDMTRRRTFGELDDGTPVMFDDNDGPTKAFLWAAQRRKGPDTQYNHLWGDPRNVRTYTALWNLCATPAFLAKTTDGSNHPEVVALLRYRSYHLYGFVPESEEVPDEPADYEEFSWPDPPAPVDDLEAVLRARLASNPKSGPARSARHLGWLYSTGPDTAVTGS